MMHLARKRATGCTNFDPRGSQDDEKVGEFTKRQQRRAQYQAERSTDITQQSQARVRRYGFDVGVF